MSTIVVAPMPAPFDMILTTLFKQMPIMSYMECRYDEIVTMIVYKGYHSITAADIDNLVRTHYNYTFDIKLINYVSWWMQQMMQLELTRFGGSFVCRRRSDFHSFDDACSNVVENS